MSAAPRNAIDESRLRNHVARLAAKPRPPGSEAHRAAAEYVEQSLRAAGLEVRRDPFGYAGYVGTNLIAEPPDRGQRERPLFVLGSHYDSIPGSPGADDNATAVAALIEIAACLAAVAVGKESSTSDVWLVAFDLEESGLLGSTHLAEALKRSGREVIGMVSLEMLGYADRRPGSQKMPAQLRGMYPDTGDFIGLVGNQRSAAFLERFVRRMNCVAGLRVESLAVPGDGELLPESRLSDHSPFWDLGYPALMVTDTSFFRNPHYHQPSDTIETIDFAFLAKVTEAVLHGVCDSLNGFA